MIEEINVKLEYYRECYTSFFAALTSLQTETDEINTILGNVHLSEFRSIPERVSTLKEKIDERQQALETIYKNDLTFSEYIVVDKMKMELSDIYEQLSTQVNAINSVVNVIIRVLDELETCERVLHEKQTVIHSVRQDDVNEGKDPLTLIDQLQAIDFHSIISQLETIKTSSLTLQEHQQEVNQKKQDIRNRCDAMIEEINVKLEYYRGFQAEGKNYQPVSGA